MNPIQINGKHPFDYHRPTEAQTEAIKNVRAAAKDFFDVLRANVPGSAESTLGVRALQQSVMWCNLAIVLQDEQAPE